MPGISRTILCLLALGSVAEAALRTDRRSQGVALRRQHKVSVGEWVAAAAGGGGGGGPPDGEGPTALAGLAVRGGAGVVGLVRGAVMKVVSVLKFVFSTVAGLVLNPKRLLAVAAVGGVGGVVYVLLGLQSGQTKAETFEDIPVANDPPTMESDPMEGVEKIEIEDEPILLEDEEF